MTVAINGLFRLGLALMMLSMPVTWRVAESHGSVEPDETCPLGIVALIPNKGSSSSPVSLYANGINSKTRLFVNEIPVHTNYAEDGVVLFEIPAFSPGPYQLYLKEKGGCKSNVVSVEITEERPLVNSIVPGELPYCTPAEDRKVILKGNNFSYQSKVLFDGLVVASNFVSEREIEIKIPQAESGFHEIQVVNRGDTSSLTQKFYIEGRPAIFNVTMGLKYEDRYEVIVEGENFLWGSELLVDGEKIGSGVSNQGCNRLIYNRQKAPGGISETSFKIVNPDGKESEVFNLSLP